MQGRKNKDKNANGGRNCVLHWTISPVVLALEPFEGGVNQVCGSTMGTVDVPLVPSA